MRPAAAAEAPIIRPEMVGLKGWAKAGRRFGQALARCMVGGGVWIEEMVVDGEALCVPE